MRGWFAAGLILAAGFATPSLATTIDFNTAPVGPVSSYTESGVTFTPIGGGVFQAVLSPNGTLAILGQDSPRQAFRAAISGGTTSVSIDLGDFDADPDTLFLSIFDSASLLLGTTTQLIAASFTGMVTLSLSNPNIFFAEFGATAPAVNGSSVFADNFTFAAATVPEPASGGLLLTALIGLRLLSQRRQRA